MLELGGGPGGGELIAGPDGRDADDGKRPPGVMDVVFGVASRREVFEAKQGEGFRGGEGARLGRIGPCRIFVEALKAWQAQCFHHFQGKIGFSMCLKHNK